MMILQSWSGSDLSLCINSSQVAESQSLLPPVDNGTDPLRRSNTPTAQPVTVMDGEIVKEEEGE